MRRTLAALLLTSLLAAAPAGAATAPPLAARLATCRTSIDPAGRFAAFTGSMPALGGTQRMAMRFDLQQRTPEATTFTTIRVPKFGVWERSLPGRPGFIYSLRVDRLLGPASYRAVVRFRWYDATGAVQRAARRVTPACRQPDLRADLRPGPLDATPGPQLGTALYRLVVVNAGRGPAGPFDVALSVGDAAPASQRVEGLAPGARRVVSFTAARCLPGTRLRAVVDSSSEVQERQEADDAADLPCPLPD
jgi:CARDB protein